MANFALTNSTNWTGQVTMGTTYTPIILVAASSGNITNAPTITGLRRGKIYDILIGTNGTPADNYVEWAVNRGTVFSSAAWLGSISSVSSETALDTADAGFAAFAAVNSSVVSSAACTLGVQNFYVGVNQRASYRWVAAPGSELVYPAATYNGFVLSARSAGYTGTFTGTVLFSEQ
jgi:hypothetical protein